jgi:pimeloyl-ACP methyl ester carboxylesterase
MKSYTLSSTLNPLREGESYYHKILRYQGEHNSTVMISLHDSLKYHKVYQKFALSLSQDVGHFEELHFIDFPGHGLSPGTRFVINSPESLSATILDLVSRIGKKKIIWFAEGMGASALLRLTLHKPKLVNPENKFILLNPFLYPRVIFPQYLEEKVPEHLNGIRIPKLYFKASLETYRNDFLVGQNLTLNLWKLLWSIFLDLKDYSYFLPNEYFLLLDKNAEHIDVDKIIKYFENHPSLKNACMMDSLEKILLDNDVIEKVCKDIKKWLD